MRADVTSVREIPALHTMGHTCANLNGELLFVWGGTNDSVAYLAIKNSTIWIYETLTGYWRNRTCSGECPPYLSSCASCLIGQKMYIFGGHSTVHDNWLNCLYCLDLETFIWTDLGAQARAQPAKPIRSDKHVAWPFNNKLYIFGGYGWSQVEHFLELLDCQKDLQLVPDHRWPKFGWNNQLVEYNPADKTWRWPNYSGKCPSARAAHSGALMGDKYFVFGGRDSRERLNDLHTLDMQTLQWQHVAVVAQDSCALERPLQRPPIGHLLESLDDEHRIVAGGAAMQDNNVAGGGSEDDHDDDGDDGGADEHHRQILEEMREVGAVDDEDEGAGNGAMAMMSSITPASSSSTSTSSTRGAGGGLEEGQGGAPKPASDEELEDEDCEYPHPSHLLERWSLSSSNTNANTDLTGCAGLELNSNQTSQRDPQQQQQQQPPLAAGANMTAPTQSVLLRNSPLRLSDGRRDLDQQLGRAADAEDWDDEDDDELARLSPQPQQQPPAPPARNNQDHPREAGRHDNDNDSPSPPPPPPQPQLAPLSMPLGRSFCSLTPISADDMLLFGGVNSQDENLDDCWLFNVTHGKWTRVEYAKHNHKLIRPRLWHTGSQTKQNEVVIIGGSCSDQIDEYCSDVLLISLEPRSLKRLALDTVSRAVRMKTIQRTRGIPSTLIKQIRLRKQAMALTTYRPLDATSHHQGR